MSKLFVVDVDSVLLDFQPVVLHYFEGRYQTKIAYEDIGAWDYEHSLGLPKKEVGKMWDVIWGERVPAMDGAHRFLSGLKGLGFTIISLSSRKKGDAVEASLRDLRRTGLAQYLDEMRYVEHGDEKGKECWAWKPDAFLDDSMKNIYSVLKECPETRCFLWDAPWNRSLDLDPPYTRVKTFDHVLREVK